RPGRRDDRHRGPDESHPAHARPEGDPVDLRGVRGRGERDVPGGRDPHRRRGPRCVRDGLGRVRDDEHRALPHLRDQRLVPRQALMVRPSGLRAGGGASRALRGRVAMLAAYAASGTVWALWSGDRFVFWIMLVPAAGGALFPGRPPPGGRSWTTIVA